MITIINTIPSLLFYKVKNRITKRNKNMDKLLPYDILMLQLELLSAFQRNKELLKFILRAKKKFDFHSDEWLKPWLLDRSLKKIKETNLGLDVQQILERNGITSNEKPILEEAMTKFIDEILNNEKDYDY